jgi:hypothetical protein
VSVGRIFVDRGLATFATNASPLYKCRPVLALASASEKPNAKHPNTQIVLYSLAHNKYMNQITFKSRVLSLACNRRVFVVALHNVIYCFDAVRLVKVRRTSNEEFEPRIRKKNPPCTNVVRFARLQLCRRFRRQPRRTPFLRLARDG